MNTLAFVVGVLKILSINIKQIVLHSVQANFLLNPQLLSDESKYRTFDILLMIILGVAAIIIIVKGVRKIVKYIRKHFDDEPY